MATRIMSCECTYKYQDHLYGVGKRVHNEMIKDRKRKGWRCTVCGNVKEADKV